MTTIYTPRTISNTTYSGRVIPTSGEDYLLINAVDKLLINAVDYLIISVGSVGTSYTGRIIP